MKLKRTIRYTRSDYSKGELVGLTTNSVPKSIIKSFKTLKGLSEYT